MVILFDLLAYLPLSVLHRLGALLGWLAWLFSPTYRRHLRDNMVLALGEDGARARRLTQARTFSSATGSGLI
jgi:KDO2-lipid IV(A) lauroyltransferase